MKVEFVINEYQKRKFVVDHDDKNSILAIADMALACGVGARFKNKDFFYGCGYACIDTPYGRMADAELSAYVNASFIVNDLADLAKERKGVDEEYKKPERYIPEIYVVKEEKNKKTELMKNYLLEAGIQGDFTDGQIAFLAGKYWDAFFRSHAQNPKNVLRHEDVERYIIEHNYRMHDYPEVRRKEIEKAKKKWEAM